MFVCIKTEASWVDSRNLMLVSSINIRINMYIYIYTVYDNFELITNGFYRLLQVIIRNISFTFHVSDLC